MHSDDIVAVELEEREWQLLAAALSEWDGPASPNEALAVAMGFAGLDDFDSQRQRLLEAVWSKTPMSRLDWSRVLISTEIVFVSDMVGSGRDWQTTTGFKDEDTIRVLRSVQRKLIGRATVHGDLAAHTGA